ncbi:MAG: hypothetical protein ISR84_00055 [Kiritimatiellales bacterium]|nr:hypothetical protein [Kiritimatiellota bacterium]MBL7015929.1 hypothetical protein [Kiritimatiellales bacterium]
MNWCEINLARDQVVSSKRRHRIYWMMMLYLLIMTGLLITATAGASSKIRNGLALHRRAQQIEKQFETASPNSPSMLTYAEELRRTLLRNETQLAEINAALPDRIQSVLPLIISVINQPGNSELYKLSFTQQTREKKPELEFSILVPAGQRDAADFLQRWKRDPLLARQFETITPSTTKRGTMGQGEVLIMSYRAGFKD